MSKCTSASIAVLSGWSWSREGGNSLISPHRRDLSEPTARAVVRGRGVSMVTALKVVRALERNPPNERLMALLNWHEAHPRPVVPRQLVTASDR